MRTKNITLEDLEYEGNYEDKDFIPYEDTSPTIGIVPKKICFNNEKKQLFLLKDEEMLILEKPLLQAIYNKCKELGWLDETILQTGD